MSLSKVPPPTAQTDHHKDLKFGMDTHIRPNRGATEAIFEKLPLSRAMGQGWGTPGGAKMSKKFFPIFPIFLIWLLRLVSLTQEKSIVLVFTLFESSFMLYQM